MDRVKKASEKAQLSKFIEGLEEGYDTNVGERGVKLSGGQRQRIGIARALYKQSSIIIFDEATSALDSKTERSLLQEIFELQKFITIIVVSHKDLEIDKKSQLKNRWAKKR